MKRLFVSRLLFFFFRGREGGRKEETEDRKTDRLGRARFAAGIGKARQFGDKPHVRHGILIRWECWPTAKRPQRFLNTRRKWVASVPAPVVQGSGMVRAGSKEGMPRGERLWPAIISSRAHSFPLFEDSFDGEIFSIKREFPSFAYERKLEGG